MKQLDRRDFLKAAGGAAALGVVGNHFLSRDGFGQVIEAVDERKEHIEEHPGQKIHFDDPNELLYTMQVGDVGPYYVVEEQLENNTVEEIGRNLPGQTEVSENIQWYDFVENQEVNMRIVHLDQGKYDVNVPRYVDETTSAFEDLLPSEYDVNVVGDVVVPDEEDEAFLQNTGEDFSDLKLSKKYSEDGELPTFLTSQDLRDHSVGHANLMQNASFVELNESEKSNISTTIHELGHLRLFLPHNYMETGVMSYNPEVGDDMRFNSGTKLLMDAITDGEVNYSKRIIEVNNLAEPDEGEYEAPLIDIEYKPGSIDTEAAKGYVAANIDEFVNQYIDATADEIVLGENETSVIYRGNENDLEILLDGDVKDARLV